MTRTLAYVVSGFPLMTETFILREVAELTRLGWPIEVFSIRHPREPVVHAEARWLEPQVHYPDWQAVLAGNLGLLVRHPHVWTRLHDPYVLTFKHPLDIEWMTMNAMTSSFLPYDERLAMISNVIEPGYARLRGDPVRRDVN